MSKQEQESEYTIKDASLFGLKLMQVSKAIWRAAEDDWEQWVKPYGLNVNEHHILCLASNTGEISMSELANLGAMHISTAFNFSKKLENQGYLHLSKRENDKRNTYIKLTENGEQLLLDTLKGYEPHNSKICKGALPLKTLYGKFPAFPELVTVVRHVCGGELVTVANQPFVNIKEAGIEENEDKKEVQLTSN